MGSSGREVRPGAGPFVGHPEMEPGRPAWATVKTAVSVSVDPRPAVSKTGVLIGALMIIAPQTVASLMVASLTVASPIVDREAVASTMVMRATAGLVAPRRPTVDLTISPAVKRVPMEPNP